MTLWSLVNGAWELQCFPLQKQLLRRKDNETANIGEIRIIANFASLDHLLNIQSNLVIREMPYSGHIGAQIAVELPQKNLYVADLL